MMVSYITAVKAITGGRIGGLNDGPLVNLKFYDGQSPPTEEEIQAKIAELQAAEPLRLLRIERDRLIQQTDRWVLPDRTATPAQLAYRQALRDLPANSTPALDENGNLTGVEWPVYSEEA